MADVVDLVDRTGSTDAAAAGEPRRGSVSRRFRRLGGALILVLVLAAGTLLTVLSEQQVGSSPRRDFEIAGRIPATVFLPGSVPDGLPAIAFAEPEPVGRRPPVVVLVHGHTADRETMSPLARSLAVAGYAVVTFDLPGHGASRVPFSATPFGSELDKFRADLKAVLDWLGRYPYVDGERILLMGHSLGAAMVVDFAARDPRPLATVAFSGSVNPYLDGEFRPRNLLFLVAADEAVEIHSETRATFGQLAGAPPVDGRTLGDPVLGTGLRHNSVEGVDHLTILYSDHAFEEALSWADTTTGRTGQTVTGLRDPRLATAGWYALCAAFLLAGLGIWAGRTAPRLPTVPARGVHWRLLALTGALVAAIAVVSVGGLDGRTLAGFLSLEGGDAVFSFLAITGGILLAVRALAAGRGTGVRPGWLGEAAGDTRPFVPGLRRLLVPALIAVAGAYILIAPLGPVFHRLVPTPQRLLLVPLAALVVFPFFFALESLLRRGSVLTATLASIAGRLIVVVVLTIGLFRWAFQDIVWLYVPFVAALFAVFEVIATGIYAACRDHRLTAVVQSALLGWIVAVLVPWNG